MRIGILTFHYSRNNFGAVLQTYASFFKLKTMGYSPTVLNLLPKKDKSENIIKKNIKFLITKSYNFDVFRKENLKITKPLYTYEDCKNQNNYFDAFYVGSDQVWRLFMSRERRLRYFLDFADAEKIKVSYAASFGTDSFEGSLEEKKIVSDLLKKFTAISVREDSGMEICKREFGVTSKHVLDPTLLLSKSDYLLIEDKSYSNISEYVALYLLDDKYCDGEVSNLTKNQLKINILNLYGETIQLFGKKTIQYSTVGKWLSGIKNSTFVITDSFHCVAFSIIYRKCFLCIINHKRGASRIYSLLTLLGLEDRICTDSEIDFTILNKKIDYDSVHEKLNELKIDSLHFLESALRITS